MFFPVCFSFIFCDEDRDDDPFCSLMMHTNLSEEPLGREKLKDFTLFRFILMFSSIILIAERMEKRMDLSCTS